MPARDHPLKMETEGDRTDVSPSKDEDKDVSKPESVPSEEEQGRLAFLRRRQERLEERLDVASFRAEIKARYKVRAALFLSFLLSVQLLTAN